MWKNNLINYFPPELQSELLALDDAKSNTLEEIRVRVCQNAELIGSDWQIFTKTALNQEQCDTLLLNLCNQSLFAIENELKRGCITLKGGYRVGIGGKALMDSGQMERFISCTFFNFRIARQKIGCALPILPLIAPNRKCLSTLVLSPPGEGKTTLLRDIGRSISNGEFCSSQKVCFIDERSELCGSDEGMPSNDIGKRSDVIDGLNKPQAIEIALRCLSPQVIVADEIGTNEDEISLIEAMGAGVIILASAHGSLIGNSRRPLIRRLKSSGLFERFICLNRFDNKRIYSVYDNEFNLLGERSS